MPLKNRFKDWYLQLFFIGPALFFFLVIVIAPFVIGMFYSFTKWNGISDKVTFVGLKNFSMLLSDENFIKSFWFTIRFSVTVIILSNTFAFVMGLMFTSSMKLKNIMRAVFFIPNVISGLILGFIWQFIFVKVFGGIGELTNIGFFQLPWLGTSSTGFWATVIVQIWQMSGYLMVIYVAGISCVPQELVEASTIDGATRLQVLRNVIIPMVMPSITVALFMSINISFKVFDLNFSLTHGNFDTRTVAFDIYQEAFTSSNYGLGTAKAFIFFIVVACITAIQTTITKKREVEA